MQTLMLITTLGGQTCSVASYIKAIHLLFGHVSLDLTQGLPLYGRLFFHIGNLFMCIERAAAVILVARYEKCVSVPITVGIVVVTSAASVFCAIMLNWLTSISHYSFVVIELLLVVSHRWLHFRKSIKIRRTAGQYQFIH
ncbi:hypothetical protein ANCCAN_21143 [Ancylostoma caninum]|uniref:Uncharacterized protein n=1 Tax=Ancylostoma caninum TaxID=29170 RepID=A0A368FLX3_ANCCA|nr:hypothetical protein ANCCAN_21143 [Ancylostoma caninum]